MIYVDSAIVLIALAAFQDWHIPLYSLIVIYISGRAIDLTLEGSDYNKALMIISKKHKEIKHKLLVDLERGGTYLSGARKCFSGEEKQVIYTVVSRREVAILEEFISKIDPDAFITVTDAKEILGEGFQSLKNKVDPDS